MNPVGFAGVDTKIGNGSINQIALDWVARLLLKVILWDRGGSNHGCFVDVRQQTAPFR